MSKLVRISDICEVFDGPHATPAKIDKGPVYLGIKAINQDGMLDENEFAYLSETDYKKWTKRVTPKENDIVFSYEATLHRYALIPNDFYGCLGRRLAIVRAKSEKVNIKWLYYYFRSPKWTEFINNHIVSGSTVNRVSIYDFPSYPVNLPSIEDQNNIVAILDGITKKIQLNKKNNSELEEMSKTIYNYWFTQFDFPDENGKPYRSSGGEMVYNAELKREIPKGWKVSTVGMCLGKVPNTLRIQSSEYQLSGCLPVIDQSADYIAGYCDNPNAKIQTLNGAIVFGDHTRVVKYIGFDFARGADGTQVMLSKNESILPQILFYQIIKNIDFSNYGYARHFKFLKDKLILLPTEDISNKYKQHVQPMYEYITRNTFENITLTKLRDWLLPMLMNGQAVVD